MGIDFNMPLSSLINKLLKGEAEEMGEDDFYPYIKDLTQGNKEELRKALDEVKTGIDKWKDSYFTPLYENKVKEYQQGKLKWTHQELDDLFNEEEYLTKEGKVELTIDYLYNAIEKIGFINGHHRDAIEAAWARKDFDFLKEQWEELALNQTKPIQAIITNMLTTASEQPGNDTQSINRPQKKIEDYPEVFGLDTCCELIAYSKSAIYKMTSKKEIPFFHSGSNGRKLLFKRDEIIEWMTSQPQKTKSEYIKQKEEELASKKSK